MPQFIIAAIRKIHFNFVVSLALLVLAPVASATVLYSQGHVTSTTDILNTGTLVSANHYGPVSITPISINGVDFGINSSGLTGMALSGGDFSNQFTPGSAMDQLFSGLWFQTGGTSSLTLTGLTIGNDYLLQLFLANNINSTGKASRVSLQSQSYDLLDFGSSADYLRISFSANASTQVVNFGTGSGAEAQRMVLNGYVLQNVTSVPEPGSLVLLGGGLMGLLALRRKRFLSASL